MNERTFETVCGSDLRAIKSFVGLRRKDGLTANEFFWNAGMQMVHASRKRREACWPSMFELIPRDLLVELEFHMDKEIAQRGYTMETFPWLAQIVRTEEQRREILAEVEPILRRLHAEVRARLAK